MNRKIAQLTPLFQGFIVILGLVLISAAFALTGNSWQKRFDRAFLQVDGVTPQGRIRSLQRALRDPKLRIDVSKAIDVVREKGFGKGHPEFIELLWPEGTQARRDLEGINALTEQLKERSTEVQGSSSSGTKGFLDIIQSTQGSLRFGEEGPSVVFSSVLEQIQSNPNRTLRLIENILRNEPKEVESPSYKLLGKYLDYVNEDNEAEETSSEKKSFLTVAPLELRQYDAFRSVSVRLKTSGLSSSSNKIYTLKNMGSALTEIFSYLELGNNARSAILPMTTPFFISGTSADGTNKMFVKLPKKQKENPPEPTAFSRISFGDVPETVMATLSFQGICTDEEIKRQKTKLMDRIQMAGDIGWKIKNQQNIDLESGNVENEATKEGTKEENVPEIFVLQYNAPGTIPWRRMNEIAIVMEKTTSAENNEEVVTEVEIKSDETDSDINEDEEEESTDDNEDENTLSTDPTFE